MKCFKGKQRNCAVTTKYQQFQFGLQDHLLHDYDFDYMTTVRFMGSNIKLGYEFFSSKTELIRVYLFLWDHVGSKYDDKFTQDQYIKTEHETNRNCLNMKNKNTRALKEET